MAHIEHCTNLPLLASFSKLYFSLLKKIITPIYKDKSTILVSFELFSCSVFRIEENLQSSSMEDIWV